MLPAGCKKIINPKSISTSAKVCNVQINVSKHAKGSNHETSFDTETKISFGNSSFGYRITDTIRHRETSYKNEKKTLKTI